MVVWKIKYALKTSRKAVDVKDISIKCA